MASRLEMAWIHFFSLTVRAINKNSFFFPKVMAEDLVEMRPFVKWEQIKACGEGLAPVLTGEQLACDLDCALFTLPAHGSCH